MSGSHTGKEKLNFTLKRVSKILNENDINDWFIFFGTLLGIIRESSCIEGDDDIDIMISHDYQKLRDVFESEDFKFTSAHGIGKSKEILKSVATDEFCSFDFYMCQKNDLGNYLSKWQNVNVKNVQIEKKEWDSVLLNLPNNPIPKLEKMYGENWRTPLKYTIQYQMEQTRKDSIYNTSKRSVI